MNGLRALLLVLLVAIPAQAIVHLPDPVAGERPAAVFGILGPGERFVATDRVPLVEGQAYGWIVQVKPGTRKVRWREVFTLPAAPRSWGSGEKEGLHRISDDRRVAVTERREVPTGGVVSNFWTVAPGDPAGSHEIQLFIDGRPVATFRFELVKQTR